MKSPLRPQQPTRVLQVQGPHLSSDHLAAATNLCPHFGLVGVHPVFSPEKCHLRIPEPRPITEKDLPELASINPHDPGIWAYVLITEWLNYYKRVTFLSVHMPGHRREFGSIPELMPVTKKDCKRSINRVPCVADSDVIGVGA